MTEKVYRKATGHEGGETRAMRGLRLFRDRGSEIVTYLDGTYGVPSETEEGVLYVVSLEEESCDCPSFRHTGETCKHVFAALLYRAKRRKGGAAAPKPPARKRCVPPMAVRSKTARDFLERYKVESERAS